MDAANSNDLFLPGDSSSFEAAQGIEPNTAPAWEEIRAGRYRPRRIKGSYRGRELG